MPFPHLPKPIYEAMPLVYVVGGLSAAAWSDSVVGVLSGLALAVAGVQVRMMRKRHRLQHEQQRALMEARLRRQWKRRVG